MDRRLFVASLPVVVLHGAVDRSQDLLIALAGRPSLPRWWHDAIALLG
jgi:hypothetical protein